MQLLMSPLKSPYQALLQFFLFQDLFLLPFRYQSILKITSSRFLRQFWGSKPLYQSLLIRFKKDFSRPDHEIYIKINFIEIFIILSSSTKIILSYPRLKVLTRFFLPLLLLKTKPYINNSSINIRLILRCQSLSTGIILRTFCITIQKSLEFFVDSIWKKI